MDDTLVNESDNAWIAVARRGFSRPQAMVAAFERNM